MNIIFLKKVKTNIFLKGYDKEKLIFFFPLLWQTPLYLKCTVVFFFNLSFVAPSQMVCKFVSLSMLPDCKSFSEM